MTISDEDYNLILYWIVELAEMGRTMKVEFDHKDCVEVASLLRLLYREVKEQ